MLPAVLQGPGRECCLLELQVSCTAESWDPLGLGKGGARTNVVEHGDVCHGDLGSEQALAQERVQRRHRLQQVQRGRCERVRCRAAARRGRPSAEVTRFDAPGKSAAVPPQHQNLAGVEHALLAAPICLPCMLSMLTWIAAV